jgi:hypothetical protein
MIKKFEKYNKIKVIKDYYYPSDKIKYKSYYFGKLRHREDGPSYQEWYENGQKKVEIWWVYDEIHREDGSAYQDWYENGQKRSESWYLNDKIYSRDEWVEELKRIGSPHYREQKMLLDIEKYNL